ncbi:hypothetical protein Vretimale_4641 [Volvox reticuliferus]|nr:hypothetical protein Vretifemale_3379 [Volvox reticuliferus]GIL99663.1 hypothetical protein Vretimale_4641 [Volvox reticuliferus]
MDDVKCLGYEKQLWSCDARKPRGANNCDHREDVAVSCYDPPPPSPPRPPTPPAVPKTADGSLRLINGNNSIGLVQMAYNGRWGTFCVQTWTAQTAVVVCRQLGLTGGTLVYSNIYGIRNDPAPRMWLRGLDCTGKERTLMSCPYDALVDNQCDPYWAAAVMCGVEDGALRLANGTEVAGRLEVLHNGGWGTVCSDNFTDVEASVACRQLGFTGGWVAPAASYSPGRGNVWMDSVKCRGKEARLTDCSFDGWAWTDCTHEDDVAVQCYHAPRRPPLLPNAPPPNEPSPLQPLLPPPLHPSNPLSAVPPATYPPRPQTQLWPVVPLPPPNYPPNINSLPPLLSPLPLLPSHPIKSPASPASYPGHSTHPPPVYPGGKVPWPSRAPPKGYVPQSSPLPPPVYGALPPASSPPVYDSGLITYPPAPAMPRPWYTECGPPAVYNNGQGDVPTYPGPYGSSYLPC